MKLKDDIDIYNNSIVILNKNNSFLEKSWIIIIIVLVLLFVIVSFIPFNIYSVYDAYVDKKYVSLIIENNDFPIEKNNKLYIKEKRYNYKLINIKDGIASLDIKLSKDINIFNNTFKVNVLNTRTTLFKIIKNRIKKGFGI